MLSKRDNSINLRHQVIWNNKNIKLGNTSVSFPTLHYNGFIQNDDLLDDSMVVADLKTLKEEGMPVIDVIRIVGLMSVIEKCNTKCNNITEK